MKTSAIIRIVIWSLVACLLISILCIGLAGGFEGFSIGIGTSYSYKDADRYDIGNGQTDGSAIHTIEVNWVSGKVQVESGDGSDIRWEETTKRTLKDSQRVHYLVENGVLKLQFRDSSWFHFGGSPAKELKVTVPADVNLKVLNISSVSGEIGVDGVSVPVTKLDSVSGNMAVRNLQGDTLDLDTVSGGLAASGLVVGTVDAESVSGSLELSGETHNWDWDTVSGSANVTSTVCPQTIDTDSVSGDVTLTLPENDGFTAEYDGSSGDLRSDFPTTGRKDTYIYKNGGAAFSFESVSGDVKILKAG